MITVGEPVGAGGDAAHVASLYACGLPARPLLPRLSGPVQSDIAVIGGGLAGLTAARELRRRGHSVALVEANVSVGEPPGRNGGFVAPGFAESLFAVERRVGLETARRSRAAWLQCCRATSVGSMLR